ncbi:TetR/AcrR family transcriptional regulator [Aerococcus urinae]|uniref:TetR/AcrR family transcriptional regulator n=1 Tax=Aerococcus urinae TaxID=1376 RepID=UPI00254A3966|nr:TetR/AcrR family transcriptional regulator [Aerococcus urinae]MDK7302963.1 helix-turn-helix domain-containing protein [Aerococcus urinae]
MDAYIKNFVGKFSRQEALTPRQHAILQASIDLFADYGYSNTSTKEIAGRAGVGEGTLFKHFGSKQNLLFACILPSIAEMSKEKYAQEFDLERIKDDQWTFQDFVHHILANCFQENSDHYKVMKIFSQEMLYRENFLKRLAELIPLHLKTGFFNILEYFKDKGELNNWPNALIVRLMISPILSFQWVQFESGSQEDFAQALSYIEAFIVRGLCC